MYNRPQCPTKISLRKLGHVFSFVKLNFRASFFFILLAQNTPSFPKSQILSNTHLTAHIGVNNGIFDISDVSL